MTPHADMLKVAKTLAARPIGEWLNYSASVDNDRLLHRLGFDERHIGNPAIRALHGGVVATFFEFAAQVELAAARKMAGLSRIVTNAVDYMAPTKAADMFASVTIDRVTRRVAFVELVGWQDDAAKPVAVARLCLRLPTAQKQIARALAPSPADTYLPAP